MRYYQPFPAAIPLYEAGYPRVTHPSATNSEKQALHRPFDLHVLSTPPAFILSQDQTLLKMFRQSRNIEEPLRASSHLALLVWSGSKQAWLLLSVTVSLGCICSILSEYSLEFSGLHYCLFVKVLCLAFVSYQTRNVDILSQALRLVKTFFNFFAIYFILPKTEKTSLEMYKTWGT